MHFSGGLSSAGAVLTTAQFIKSWLWPQFDLCNQICVVGFSLRMNLAVSEEQLCVIKHSTDHAGLKGRQINILYPCVRGKVAPLDAPYHCSPPLPAKHSCSSSRWHPQMKPSETFIINNLLCMEQRMRGYAHLQQKYYRSNILFMSCSIR